jgi:ferritin-like metal-binding protein YciE
MPLSSPRRKPIEHYEISRYGSLIAWAKDLGCSDG